MNAGGESPSSRSALQLLEYVRLSRELFENQQRLRELCTRLRRADPRGVSAYEMNCRLRAALSGRDETVRNQRTEIGNLSRQLDDERGRPPAGPPDELQAEIDAQWKRLYADYREYRKTTPYPQPPKGRR